MAELYYAVYEGAGATPHGYPIQYGSVTIAGTAADSAVIAGNGTYWQTVRLSTPGKCYVAFGPGQTAANDGSEGLPFGNDISTAEYFPIKAGDTFSVIERT